MAKIFYASIFMREAAAVKSEWNIWQKMTES